MTREEFKNIVKAIRGAYINSPINSQQVFDEWYMLLSDMDYLSVSKNLQRHIQKRSFPPTIADLRDGKCGFGNFQERRYDMDKLELALLGISIPIGIEGVKKC